MEFLVELHERESRSQGDELIQAFSATHEVEIIWAVEERTASDIKAGSWQIAASLIPSLVQRLDEQRGYRMRWLHAVPRSAVGTAGV